MSSIAAGPAQKGEDESKHVEGRLSAAALSGG
jgi:hypothetical protein